MLIQGEVVLACSGQLLDKNGPCSTCLLFEIKRDTEVMTHVRGLVAVTIIRAKVDRPSYLTLFCNGLFY